MLEMLADYRIDGSSDLVATNIDRWLFHPNDPSVDVAALPLIEPSKNVDYRVYPLAAGYCIGNKYFIARRI